MAREHEYPKILKDYEDYLENQYKDSDIIKELKELKERRAELGDYAYRLELIRWKRKASGGDLYSDVLASDLTNFDREISNFLEETRGQSHFFLNFAKYGFPIAIVVFLLFVVFVVVNAITATHIKPDDVSLIIQYCFYALAFFLLVTLVYVHFLLRFYQQSLSLQKQLMEKKIGAKFLETALKDKPENRPLYILAFQMFVSHQPVPAPFSPEDNPLCRKFKDE